MAEPDFAAVEPSPAATIVVLRDGPGQPEVLMLRRSERARFMPGAHVFPGGAVDPQDREIATEHSCDGLAQAGRLPHLTREDAAAHHVAAVRELFEEAGVLLARDAAERVATFSEPAISTRFEQYRIDVHAGSIPFARVLERESLRLALDLLVPWAHWVTPPIHARRFDTWFFVARMPESQVPVHDSRETTESTWMTAAHALARARRREIELAPPTWFTLRELEEFGSVADATAWPVGRPLPKRELTPVVHDGRRMLVPAGEPSTTQPASDRVPTEARFVFVDGRWMEESEWTP
jgi:8-oxo-dGTP pyrophosphatase MutT (NUDIX family)